MPTLAELFSKNRNVKAPSPATVPGKEPGNPFADESSLMKRLVEYRSRMRKSSNAQAAKEDEGALELEAVNTEAKLDIFGEEPYRAAADDGRESTGSFRWYGVQESPAVEESPSEERVPSNESAPVEVRSEYGVSVPLYGGNNLRSDLEKLFKENDIHAVVTSFIRESGKVGNAGDKSYHRTGQAVDIVPAKGYTFDNLRTELLKSERVIDFFALNGLGVLDETDPEIKKKTGATGDHYHIGPDRSARSTWQKWLDNIDKYAGKRIYTFQKGTKEYEAYRKGWTVAMFDNYMDSLKKVFGNSKSESDYRDTAIYLTAQSALESGWGTDEEAQRKSNYGGYMDKNGNLIEYRNMGDFADSNVRNLKSKWPSFINQHDLKDYVRTIHEGQYKYSVSDGGWTGYYDRMKGMTNKVREFIGERSESKSKGGKFENIRSIYAKS